MERISTHSKMDTKMKLFPIWSVQSHHELLDSSEVAAEALKYSYRTDFMRETALLIKLYLGWLDEICRHMRSTADGYHHCVYVIVNRRLNKAYIGITRQHFAARIKIIRPGNSAKSSEISSFEDTELSLTE